nr:pericentrin-like [Columba livia]
MGILLVLISEARKAFAYYRQRKTKSDVAQSQKKTAKRKSSSVHTHDVPKEEHALAARGLGKGMERKDEATNKLETTEGSAGLSSWDVPDDHAAQETTVQEQNEVIRKLTSCLQQAKEDRDDLQEEASRVAGQIHDIQLQLHQA